MTKADISDTTYEIQPGNEKVPSYTEPNIICWSDSNFPMACANDNHRCSMRSSPFIPHLGLPNRTNGQPPSLAPRALLKRSVASDDPLRKTKELSFGSLNGILARSFFQKRVGKNPALRHPYGGLSTGALQFLCLKTEDVRQKLQGLVEKAWTRKAAEVCRAPQKKSPILLAHLKHGWLFPHQSQVGHHHLQVAVFRCMM